MFATLLVFFLCIFLQYFMGSALPPLNGICVFPIVLPVRLFCAGGGKYDGGSGWQELAEDVVRSAYRVSGTFPFVVLCGWVRLGCRCDFWRSLKRIVSSDIFASLLAYVCFFRQVFSDVPVIVLCISRWCRTCSDHPCFNIVLYPDIHITPRSEKV